MTHSATSHVFPLPSEAVPPQRFTLIVATIRRVSEVAALLESLTVQTYPHFDVIVVDQNPDDRLVPLLHRYRDTLSIQHLRSIKGLSRARNVALEHATGDIIAFPDDDCVYPPNLLEQVENALSRNAPIEGIAILPQNAEGEVFPRLHRRRGALSQKNAFRRCVSIGLFFRSELIRRTGTFNESLGLGANTPWSSAEDVDYPLRALLAGCRIEYRPDIRVLHSFGIRGKPRELARRGYELGGGVGYVLRRHRFPITTALEIVFIRPTGGLLMGILRGSWSEVCFYSGTLCGKVRGWMTA
jgi:glycosyltransferase involved in cell wall biosynthesis